MSPPTPSPAVWAHAGTLYVRAQRGTIVRIYTPSGLLRDQFLTTGEGSGGGSVGGGFGVSGSGFSFGSDEGFSSGGSGTVFAAGGTNTRVAATTSRAAAGDEDEEKGVVVLTTRRLPAPGVYIVTLNGGPGWKVLTE